MSSSSSASISASASSSSAAGSGSASSSRSSNSSSTVSIPATAAAGGITITQPPASASASYYKIASNEYITFGWNLTSLYVTPTSLTLIASCSANGNTYPVGPTSGARNTIPANSSSVVWNPYEWENVPGAVPFAEATYVLKIWDERGPGSTIKGGYMSPYAGLQFAMYRPQAYTAIASGWTCTTCSNAFETLSEPVGIAMFLSLLITLFTGWNILRR